MTIGVLKDGKWVFNKACTAPWCHALVNFSGENEPFSAVSKKKCFSIALRHTLVVLEML